MPLRRAAAGLDCYLESRTLILSFGSHRAANPAEGRFFRTSDTRPFDPIAFLARVEHGNTKAEFSKRQTVFAQGDPPDAVLYIENGKVELKVFSRQGKEAILGVIDAGNFFGEGCLAGQQLRMATAVAVTECSIRRLEKSAMILMLRDEPVFSELFISYLLTRNIRIEEDLVDHLFNSSEKRLARLLLLLANFGKEGKPEPVITKVSQETLAEMIGTTRSRVSFFTNKFRKLGFIEYNGVLRVHSSLLNVVFPDGREVDPGSVS
jgi:CRP/FNR family cyclic AMP-dependent transcriptional regulator